MNKDNKNNHDMGIRQAKTDHLNSVPDKKKDEVELFIGDAPDTIGREATEGIRRVSSDGSVRKPASPSQTSNPKKKKKRKNKWVDRLLLTLAAALLITAGILYVLPIYRDRQRANKVQEFVDVIKEVTKQDVPEEEVKDTVVTFVVPKDANPVPGEELESPDGETYDVNDVLNALPDNVTLTALGAFQIPSVEMDIPLLDDAGVVPLRYGAGMLKGTAMPGQEGNLVILGHNMRKDGSLFNRLKNVVMGDEIVIHMVDGTTYTYVVDKILQPVHPADLPNYIDIDDGEGKQITLITCTLSGGTHRLLVIGHLKV